MLQILSKAGLACGGRTNMPIPSYGCIDYDMSSAPNLLHCRIAAYLDCPVDLEHPAHPGDLVHWSERRFDDTILQHLDVS